MGKTGSARPWRDDEPPTRGVLRLSDLRVAAGVGLANTAPDHHAGVCDRGNPPITGTAVDSRRVRPGDLFAALPGRQGHGAAHAVDAVAAGAVAILTDLAGERLAAAKLAGIPFLVVDNPRAALGLLAAAVHDHPARDLSLVGVTGTNGKTTITYLVESALRAAGQTTGLIGTVEERMGAHTRRSSVTTPDAPELHRLLAQMRDADVDTVAMECSSHALEQDRLAGLVYDVVAFTNLTREHLDHHGSMEAYYQAKAWPRPACSPPASLVPASW